MVYLAEEQLRRDLINGRLEPGARLKMQELQGLYGFSSTPLREALSRLSQVGLIEADARRGFNVPPLSAEDFTDITHLRVLIDTNALARSIQFGDDDWEANVVAAFYKLEKIETRLGSGPVALDSDWADAHKTFHMELLSYAQSPRSLQLSNMLFDQADRYRRVSARMRTRPRNKSDEHKMIMEAALGRDTDKACELLRNHIRHTLSNVIDALIAQSKVHKSSDGLVDA
ncbi:GntR family transcriptional regulator [Leucobacter denitrificans]|uniref:GntR family transcriptional regulator n=2 Tax=Leucobacter denitrificans TaxID=683042 RepID=A0A7G9S826_9MICO|nr:GntR family transcriptional regulator [Leucobacter denitrificans]